MWEKPTKLLLNPYNKYEIIPNQDAPLDQLVPHNLSIAKIRKVKQLNRYIDSLVVIATLIANYQVEPQLTQ